MEDFYQKIDQDNKEKEIQINHLRQNFENFKTKQHEISHIMINMDEENNNLKNVLKERNNILEELVSKIESLKHEHDAKVKELECVRSII